MIFYHGTTQGNWELIQKEGVLFGRRFEKDYDGSVREVSRCTYLSVDKEEASMYGDVILKVDYDPTIHPKMNNYIYDCWQVRVYEPIPITNIRKI